MAISSLADLKKAQAAINQKVADNVKTMNSGGFEADPTIYKVQTDKTGNGYAIIRLLPAPKGEELPYVKIFSHSFKGPGGWYINNSLTTFKGEKDPVGEANSELWNTGIEANKDIARQRGRRTNYFSNILVIKDPKNPDNEGKVFKYKFGAKIWEKISAKVTPVFEGEQSINPFCPWTGCDLRLIVKQVKGFPNYDDSVFLEPRAIGTDDYIESIWEQEYSLAELLDRKHFKTYDELNKKFQEVLNGNGRSDKKEERSDRSEKRSVVSSVQASQALPQAAAALPVAADESMPWDNDDYLKDVLS